MFGGWSATDVLWRSGLAAIPLVLVVAGICRCLPCRPWTRHVLWVTVLAVMVLLLGAPLLPKVDVAALGTLLPKTEPLRGPAVVTPAPTASSGATAADRDRPASQAIAPRVADQSRERSVIKKSLPETVTPAPSRAPAAPAPTSSAISTSQAAPATVALPPAKRPVVATRPVPNPAPTNQKPAPARRSEPWTPQVVGPPALAVIQGLNQESAAPVELAVTSPIHDAAPRVPAPNATGDRGLAATGASGPGPVLYAVRENLGRLLNVTMVTIARWQSGLTTLRDDLFALPSVPPEAWLCGAATIGLVGCVQIARCRRLIKRARPAPASVTMLVRGAARTLGLRRVPEVLMVDDRVSPMVWCALYPRLVLPAPLWAELDLIGRSAVIHHELAHLKRRDHWVCWLEMLVGLVYWWHPLAWFVRRRVREEADLCCDAWVTTLFPRDRRAYAQALLETRKYVSGAGLGAPALGLTVMSAGAKRFARRLTMVMTQRVRPGRSIAGTALSLVLAAGALVTGPLWACPPEKDKEKAQTGVRVYEVAPESDTVTARVLKPAKAAKAPKALTYSPRVAQPTAPAPPAAPAPPVATTWRAMTVPVVPLAPTTPEPEASTFERHMAGRSPVAIPAQPRQPSDSSLDRVERRLEELSRRLDEFARRLDAEGGRERRAPTPKPSDPTRRPRSDAGAMLYQDALAQLGSTQPTAVSGPCVIAVDQSGNVKIWRLHDGSLESVTELMGRSHAPLVYDGHAHAAVGLGQALKAEKLHELAMLESHAAASKSQANSAALKELLKAKSMKRDMETKARGEALRSGAAAQQRAAEQLRKRAAEIKAKADEVNRHADQMREEADHVRRQSDESAGGERDALLSKAEAMTTEAENIREQAESLTEQAEALAENIEEINSEAAEASGQDFEVSIDPEVTFDSDAMALDVAADINPEVTFDSDEMALDVAADINPEVVFDSDGDYAPSEDCTGAKDCAGEEDHAEAAALGADESDAEESAEPVSPTAGR